MWSNSVLNLVAVSYSLGFFSIQPPTAARTATSLACNRRMCRAFQFGIDLSNASGYLWVWVFLKSYLAVKQLIFKKAVTVSLDESATQGSAHLQECLTSSLPDTLLSHIWHEMRKCCLCPYLQSSACTTHCLKKILPCFS